jgi:septal ring factor EnvC (AmiA/AmiB activator)
MNDASADVRAVLQAALGQQADGYTAALQRAVELAAAWERGEAIDERLQELVTQVQAHEASLAPVKRQWEQAGRPTDEPLRRALDRVAALIRQLGHELQSIETAARQRRDRLAVEIDVCNRQRQMQRAYLPNRGKS